jgi:hypothetical protein
MFTFELHLEDLQLNREEIYLNLGYGKTVPDEHVAEMLETVLLKAHQICRPRVGYVFCEGMLKDKNHLELNGVSFKTGPIINNYLQQSVHFAVFVATAGKAYDEYLHQLKEAGDIMDEFLADAVGSEIAEAAVRYVIEKITDEVAKRAFKITKPYSPGYCGWHVREQQLLFSLFPDEPCGIKLNTSSLMHPVKSVSGMVGIGPDVTEMPYACDICGLQSCYKRKTTLQE